MTTIALLSLFFLLSLGAAACPPCHDCQKIDLPPDSRYLIIRDCLHPCYLSFKSSSLDGRNYTVQAASYQDYMEYESDLWSLSSYFGSGGRTQCYAAPEGSLPLQVPSGKLAFVFTCPGNETCSLEYKIETGQTWLEKARRENTLFYSLLAAIFLCGLLCCGLATFCGAFFATAAPWPRRQKEQEMVDYI